MRKFISVLLALSMFFSISTVFAENELKEVQVYDKIEVSEYEKNTEPVVADEVVSNAAIDTSEFTEDNVLYKAIQSKRQTKSTGLKRFSAKKAAVQNTETVSTDEVTADFDIVMNFDMSSDMYDFDVNGDKEWLEDFKAIAEQAPDNTRYSVVSSDTEGFTYDLETSIDDVQNDNYTGESDIFAMLDDSAAAFDDDPDNRNKVVIATTQTVEDVDELEDKLDELRNDDIIPFVFILNEEIDNSLDIDGVYECSTDLELRMSISDLYLSLAEFKNADSTLCNGTNEELLTLSSVDTANDYKAKHKFGDLTSPGEALISILNIYNCIPLIAKINTSTQYDLFDLDISVLNSFLEKDNKTLSASDDLDALVNTWDNIFNSIHNKYTTNQNIETVITNNLKRRFPVFVYSYNSSTHEISDIEIIANTNGVTDGKYVFDTYKYLMNTISNSVFLHDSISNSGELTIETAYPTWYNIVTDEAAGNTIRKKALDNKANFNEQVDWHVVRDHVLKITTSQERKFVVGSLVTYSAGLPDVANVNKVYYTRKYTDIPANHWAYDYIISSTNKGIVLGFDDGTFQPDGKLTRGQFVLILLKAAQINADDTALLNVSEIKSQLNNADFDMPAWIKGYMNYAFNNGLINAEQYIGKNGIDTNGYLTGYAEPLDRAEASFMLNRLFIEKANDVNVPSNIYNYDGISNYRTNLWENHNAFVEQKSNDGNNSFNNMYYVKQMYYNNVLDGMYGDSRLGDDPSKIYFYPKKTLTRAEACKIILKCLFELDDNISEIQATVFEDYVPEYDLPNGEHISTRYVLDGNVPFDASNQIVYHFTIDDDYEYAIETIGGDEITYLWGRMFNKTKHKVFNNISIENSNHMLIVFKGAGDYDLRLKRTGQADVGLRIKRTGMSDLAFKKDTNSNFIYVNSPEFITNRDIVDDALSIKNRKLFEAKEVTGKNTYYQTHMAWYGKFAEEYEPSDSFYIDVDFYNPTDKPITVNVTNLAYGTNYDIIQYYYRSNSASITLSIPQHEHKLLFESLEAPLHAIRTPGPPEDDKWSRVSKPTILFDFQVNGGFVTVSSLAAYNHDNLHLINGEENIMNSGESIDSGEIIYEVDSEGNPMWDINNGHPRPNESDLYGKYKGIAKSQSAWIDADLHYIIDETTPKGEPLKVNLSDPYYENGVNNPKIWWITNLNPLNDKWSGVLYAMPENDHRFQYHRDSGGVWNFAFDYRNLKHINNNAVGLESINDHVDSSIIDDAKSDVKSGWKEHFPDYPDDGNDDTDESRAPDPDSIGIGSWGATNHYRITISNADSMDDKYVTFQVKNFDNLTYGYKAFGSGVYDTTFCIGESEVGSDWWAPDSAKSVCIPKHTEITFEIVTNMGAGHGGLNARLLLEERSEVQ